MRFSGSSLVVMTDCVLKFEVVIGWVVLLVSFTNITTVQRQTDRWLSAIWMKCGQQLWSIEMCVTDYCVTGFKEILKISKIIGVTWRAQGVANAPPKFPRP